MNKILAVALIGLSIVVLSGCDQMSLDGRVVQDSDGKLYRPSPLIGRVYRLDPIDHLELQKLGGK
jgi:hypothetical protein